MTLVMTATLLAVVYDKELKVRVLCKSKKKNKKIDHH